MKSELIFANMRDAAAKKLHDYCEAHTTHPGPLLHRLERETHLKTLSPHMITGPLQGQLLRMISMLLRPHHILEVGTFTGYAALCLAQGLPPGGKLYTIEANPELAYIIEKYIAEAGLQEKVTLITGDALEIIPELPVQDFDLVYLDAGKLDYPQYYDLILPKMSNGGWLVADNVLWSGKVLDVAPDRDTQVIQAFNDRVQNDPRVENLLLPLRDGLLLARKL